jgi:Zn-dependent protease
MGFSWKMGRVSGIDLFLHPTFLMLLAYVGLTHQSGLLSVLLVSAVFGCVLLHELGHALMARRFGIRTLDITLYPIGGVARLERMPRNPGAEFLIALAGPAVNLAIAAGLGGLAFLSGAWEPGAYLTLADHFVSSLIGFNLVLALFNLVPAFPMDGGRVLRALLSGWLGRLRATEIAAQVGQVLALAFGGYCLLQRMPLQAFLAAFIFFAARGELAQVRFEEQERLRRKHEAGKGVWFAPPGHVWVNRGPGQWELTPITLGERIGGGERVRSWC